MAMKDIEEVNMIHIFNRRDLLITYSMKEQARVRDILRQNKIDYTIKTLNRNSPSALSDIRAKTGTLGQDMDIAYQYTIYVKKADYELAQAAISGDLGR